MKKKGLLVGLLLCVMSFMLAFAACGDGNGCGNKKTGTITLNMDSATVEEYSTVKLEATLSEGLEGDLVWTSSDASIATVSDGVVTGVKVGTATITAKVGDISAECAVTVVEMVEVPVLSLSADKFEILVNKGVTLDAFLSHAGKSVQGVEIEFTSLDESIAKVENGKIVGLKAGTTTITARATYKGTVCEANCNVIVKNNVLITFTQKEVLLKTNENIDNGMTSSAIEYQVVKNDVIDSSITPVSYESSNTQVATVDADGVITKVGPGTADIAVNFSIDSVSYTEYVNVTVEKSSTILAHKDEEVYNRVEGTLPSITPIANKFEFELEGESDSILSAKFVLLDMNDKEIVLDVDDYTVSGGKLIVDAMLFGSSNYGDTSFIIETSDAFYLFEFKIVTKFIASYDDLYNMFYYGGWATREMTEAEIAELGANGGGTCYTYGGYFLQTNDFDIAYNCAPRFRPHLNETNKITNMLNGFTGVYDGGNYTIGGQLWQITAGHMLGGTWHDYKGLGNSGLFGNVSSSGKIQNLNIDVNVGSSGSNQYDMGIIAKTFCGTLENVSIVAKCEANTLCTHATNPIATYVSGATLTNVSIALDMSETTFAHSSTTSVLGSWYLMGQWSNSYKSSALTLNNVHIYVKVSELNTPVLYNNVAWESGAWVVKTGALGSNLDGVAQYEYNSENTILPENLDANVWEIKNGVPKLKSA